MKLCKPPWDLHFLKKAINIMLSISGICASLLEQNILSQWQDYAGS